MDIRFLLACTEDVRWEFAGSNASVIFPTDADMKPPFVPICLVWGGVNRVALMGDGPGHDFLAPQRTTRSIDSVLPHERLDRQNFRIFWSIPFNQANALSDELRQA